MANTRTFYAVKQLAVKNTNYANNGWLLDSLTVIASGVSASGVTAIALDPDTAHLNLLPAPGQLITPSGEVIRYTTVSGSPNDGVAGCTRGYIGTLAAQIEDDDELKYAGWEAVKGVQSVGVTTNFGLEQVFEFGQLEIYENIENIPDIEVTIERVLDGTKPLWFMVTDEIQSSLNPAIATYQADIGLSIYPDSQSRASGTVQTFMFMSGMFISSATYTYGVDGNFTEAITMVGNDKTWLLSANAPTGAFTGVADDATVIGSGVQRRENFQISESILPLDLPGVVGAAINNGAAVEEHLQTVTLSVDIGREEIFELGAKKPFFRTVTFPIEVSATFEVITAEGDKVEALSDNASNLTNRRILIRTDSDLQIDLGSENKLLSIDFGGGDAGGGNDTITYTYQSFNVFSVSHGNPNYQRKVGP